MHGQIYQTRLLVYKVGIHLSYIKLTHLCWYILQGPMSFNEKGDRDSITIISQHSAGVYSFVCVCEYADVVND